MFDELFHTLCQVGIFVIFAQMILHLRPRERYEKYIKFLIGGMVLLQLLVPVINCLKSDTVSTPILDVGEFAARFEKRMEEITQHAHHTEQLQTSFVNKEVDRLLEEAQRKEMERKEDHELARIEPVEKIDISDMKKK